MQVSFCGKILSTVYAEVDFCDIKNFIKEIIFYISFPRTKMDKVIISWYFKLFGILTQ